MKFSRVTIDETLRLFYNFTGTEDFDRFFLRFSIEELRPINPNKKTMSNALFKYYIENPESKGPLGDNLFIELIEYFYVIFKTNYPDIHFSHIPELYKDYSNFINTLNRDGYDIKDQKVVKIIPELVELPEKEDDLIQLLKHFNFNIAQGHYNQAVTNHTKGNWAACNSQLRTFTESLFIEIAKESSVASNFNSAIDAFNYLTELSTPPLFFETLNEYKKGGLGFINGFWKRLHPAGSHPGLSDEKDSNFRLHIVILVAHHYLNRLFRQKYNKDFHDHT